MHELTMEFHIKIEKEKKEDSLGLKIKGKIKGLQYYNVLLEKLMSLKKIKLK